MATFTIFVNDHGCDLRVFKGVPEGPIVKAARVTRNVIVIPEVAK